MSNPVFSGFPLSPSGWMPLGHGVLGNTPAVGRGGQDVKVTWSSGGLSLALGRLTGNQWEFNLWAVSLGEFLAGWHAVYRAELGQCLHATMSELDFFLLTMS